MEKIRQKMAATEASLKKEITIDVLEKSEDIIQEFEETVDEISKLSGKGDTSARGKELSSNFVEEFDQFFETINKKFRGVVSSARQLESEKSPRDFVVPKLHEIFSKIAEDNIYGISVYNEIVNDLKVRMELELIDIIEKQLYGIRDSFGEVKKISGYMQQEFSSIQKVFSDIKEKYQEKFNSIGKDTELLDDIIPKLNTFARKLPSTFEAIQKALETELSAVRNTALTMLDDMKQEISLLLQGYEGTINSLEADKKTLEANWEQLSRELANKDNLIEEMQTSKSELFTDHEALIKDIEIKDERIKALEDEITTLNAQKEALSKELETKSSRIATLETDVSELESTKTAIKEELDAKINTIETLEANITTLETEKQDLSQQIEAKIAAFQLIENERSELQTTINDTRIEVETKTKTIEELEENKTQLHTKVSELSQQLEETKDSLNKINSNIELLKLELDEKDRVINELEESKAQLRGELEIELSKKLEERISKLEYELKEVSQFLEKSPKYQLLYLINNLGETSLLKLKELTKFDEGIINLSLQDLSQKGLVTLSGEGNALSIQIKQKLNPLSCIEQPSLFKNQVVEQFKSYTDLPSFESGFNQLLNLINEYKDVNREEAGYLLSILYLYIYESQNYQFLDRIRDLHLDLKQDSFYLRLVENAVNRNPWESKKSAELEGMVAAPALKKFKKDYKLIEDLASAYPEGGTYRIKTFRPLSLLDWGQETEVEPGSLNQFSSVEDLARWVWLNGKGNSFSIEFSDSGGQKHEVIISAADKVDAQLFIKKKEYVVD
jgi:predicted  nucleic acid-binding Zn-ribbon protein